MAIPQMDVATTMFCVIASITQGREIETRPGDAVLGTNVCMGLMGGRSGTLWEEPGHARATAMPALTQRAQILGAVGQSLRDPDAVAWRPAVARLTS